MTTTAERSGERQAGAVLRHALPPIGQTLDQSQEGSAKRDVMLIERLLDIGPNVPLQSWLSAHPCGLWSQD